MKKLIMILSLVTLCALSLGITTAGNKSDYLYGPDGDLIAAHAKDITFYNKTHKLAYFTISGADWIYTNGTIFFKRTSEIIIKTDRNVKGSVWICTYNGWNPLKGEAEYYNDRGYCYITSIKYGKAEIPAAKLVPGKKYVIMVGLYDSSYVFKYEGDKDHNVWIRTNDPNTFDRVEIYGYGPIERVPFVIVVEK